MTIAIIIPIYNQAQYLRACLDSLVAQTDGDFVAYCVNDGSTDDSQSIIDEYAARDARFVPVRQPNRGLSAARNAGLAAAEERGGADAYMFLDSDDFFHAQCVEFVRRAAKEHTGCVIDFDYAEGGSAEAFRKRVYCYDSSRVRSFRGTGTSVNKLYPRSVLGGGGASLCRGSSLCGGHRLYDGACLEAASHVLPIANRTPLLHGEPAFNVEGAL